MMWCFVFLRSLVCFLFVLLLRGFPFFPTYKKLLVQFVFCFCSSSVLGMFRWSSLCLLCYDCLNGLFIIILVPLELFFFLLPFQKQYVKPPWCSRPRMILCGYPPSDRHVHRVVEEVASLGKVNGAKRHSEALGRTRRYWGFHPDWSAARGPQQGICPANKLLLSRYHQICYLSEVDLEEVLYSGNDTRLKMVSIYSNSHQGQLAHWD